jgi:hypothetical protein
VAGAGETAPPPERQRRTDCGARQAVLPDGRSVRT